MVIAYLIDNYDIIVVMCIYIGVIYFLEAEITKSCEPS